MVPSAPQAPTERTVEHSVTRCQKDPPIGVYLNVLPDCTSGPLPTTVVNPRTGKVVVKTAKAKATNWAPAMSDAAAQPLKPQSAPDVQPEELPHTGKSSSNQSAG